MSIDPPITGTEAADRLAIRELFDAYAHCADRRDAKGQMALFTEDTRFVVYMDARDPEPTQDLHGREALAPVFDALNADGATMHFNGQSTVELDGDRATGESYCLAHHLTEAEDGSRTLMVASIRYLDTFVKQDRAWLFAERNGRGRFFVDAAYPRFFKRELDYEDRGAIGALLQEIGVPQAGFDDFAAADGAAALAAHHADAEQQGVFAVPTFVVDGELFWGQDRIDFVRAKLTAKGAS